MGQKKKNIRLLIILGILVAISISLWIIPSLKKTTSFQSNLFQLSDTASIDKMIFESQSLKNELLRTDSGWVINGSYQADNNIIMVLFSVMENVEIVRSIGENQIQELSDNITDNGVKVNFYSGEKIIKSFVAGSNETKTLSIFKTDDQYFIVQIPGYESYVTGIFEIPAIDWRNRLITSVGPMNLAKLSITNYVNPDRSFEIKIDNNFPYIDGIQELDTVKLMDYLDQFRYFQADKFVKLEKGGTYDSLLSVGPIYKYSFKKYDSTKNVDVLFYPKVKTDPYLFATTSNNQNALFSYKRISGIFVDKKEFDLNEKKSR